MDFLKNIEPRKYQSEIFETCKEKNCLVILPTGLGKTLIALLLTIHRMKTFPGQKVVFLAPTKPLAEQHLNYFKKHLTELFGEMQLFTGGIKPELRKKLWESADIIFSTPQCVDGSTIIFSEEGPIKIRDFFEQFNLQQKITGKEVYTANINKKVLGYRDGKVDFVKAIKVIKFEADKTLKIKTEMKNILECTPEHPLLTIDSSGKILWKKAENLNLGDYIASIKKITVKEGIIDIWKLMKNSRLKITNKENTLKLLHCLKLKNKDTKLSLKDYSRFRYNFIPVRTFFNLIGRLNLTLPKSINVTDWTGKSKALTLPRYLDRNLSYVIGAMLGDGHIGNRMGHGSEVVFSELDSKERSSEFKETINNLFGENMKESKSKGLISYNSALSEILLRIGVPKGKKALKIKVPKFIFFSSEDCIGGFLKGIFDTDGSAGKHSVSISSISQEFIEGIKWLFLRIGISGSVEKHKSNGTINERKIKESTIYTFRFSSRKQIERFLEICRPHRSKCQNLIKTLENTKKPFTRSKEILPVLDVVKEIYAENKNKFPAYLAYCLSKENLQRISSVSQGKKNEELKKLLALPIRWVKIKEIEESKNKKIVYDLTIEKYHNFITNQIISHNCVANDLRNNLYDLNEVCLLIEDEAHRCVKNYDYNLIAKKYMEQSKNPRIIGLTASPGSDLSKISEICRNLSIESVESRTRESEDVKEYLQELNFEIIKLDFPPELLEIKLLIKKIYDKKVEELKNRKLLWGVANKKTLLELQSKIMRMIAMGNRNFNVLAGASACATTIKLQHAIELLETQTLYSLQQYFFNLFEQAKNNKSKAIQHLVKQEEFNKSYTLLNELLSKKIEHPKLSKLKEIVDSAIQKNEKTKFLIFTQFRDTAARICKEINSNEKVRAKVFVGQTKKTTRGKEKQESGLSQKEQQSMIREFSLGEINSLVATSIGEEGLDLPEISIVIFYEPIPSAIRTIQRRGRTARLAPGKLIILITKGTRDETYYWTSFQKEKKMHKIISELKGNFGMINDKEKSEKQKELF